ncbi:aldolase [Paenibacillus polysaccharolyticus]|uniref:aldolase n=1 Tax=Paenibacillus polysaccharolyticus TaxID=582692 RepID=UPI00203F5BA7|nr:aldolase [Paenibacillus polysaccharolyticus]MCM3131522.1 aldolase [Paenibacillus polysaccharolyticus]
MLPVHYEAYGLRWLSQIPMPELQRAPIDAGTAPEAADVQIESYDLTKLWESWDVGSDNFVARNGCLFFRIEDTGLFLMEHGKRIIVSPVFGADEKKVRLFILGTCMSVIMMQRGILPLHGSAVVIEGWAYAFVGHSGAGKSTLSAALASRGYPLLTDDVVALTWDAGGRAIVSPGYPQQKLWQPSLDGFGMTQQNYATVHAEITKYAIPVQHYFHERAVPLAGIYELVPQANQETRPVQLEEVSGLERLHLLCSHTFRGGLVTRQGLAQWLFETASRLSASVEISRISRTGPHFTAFEMVERIINHIRKGVHNRI